jgi:hypothetical protein
MNCWVIGKILKISPVKYGVMVKVRETKIGGTSKNGHNIGTVDQIWNFVTSSQALTKYINQYFRVGATVLINGWAEQHTTREENEPISQSLTLKIISIDLWNMGDPKKVASKEKFNESIVGNSKPTVSDFNSDF